MNQYDQHSPTSDQPDQRYEELLADESLGMLADEDRTELETLRRLHGEDSTFLATAARLQSAGSETPLSRELRASILQDAIVNKSQATSAWQSVTPIVGWLAVAAAIAIGLRVALPFQSTPSPTLAELRATAVSETTPIAFAPTADFPDMTGDVVWNDASQVGFMRLANLTANDTSKEQYQLWIFDKTKDTAYPVDGGVFDASAGETIVAIDAKIRVDEATTFAITVEKPGGVVVSDRKRLVALAVKEDRPASN